MPTEVVLVRHGESEWNAIGRYQGQIDVPLSERGRAQVTLAGEKLRSEEIAAVYSSPLRRAHMTAEAIAQPHGLDVKIEPALTEIHHGAWQGLYAAEVAERYPEVLACWKERPGEVQMPDGESIADLQKRVLPAVHRIVNEWADRRVVLASHDAIIRVILLAALGMEADRFWQIHLDNAGVTRLCYNGRHPQRPCLLTLNDAAHLAHLRADTAVQAL